ncbi:type II toxin-antitoxin system RelE/ParE family toxin [Aliiglaciecola sp. LCG003]|uniref:type II toxin-antitoxin system RelE/ParE family toxin n=1 Tax=Aliiglaciecola sp. LCG003 TaxID=3053655 RepID=UPI00257322B7|nr:type II toxin-antitoxin system RelE/ParE family toxin [Aliiglaciecola sp. LCG003]WJG08148.1 type II toxin-antitoxin system RelE/ParE family toxin [Aliiglaciecola sp. LCG003]
MASYRLAPLAELDMEAIGEYSFEQWGINQANYYADELVLAFEGLAESPCLGVSCDNVRVGYKFYRQGKHLIYFKTTDYGVAVIRILHERMSPSLFL